MEHVYYLIYVERPDTSVCIVTDNALIVPMRTALVTPFCPSFYCPPAVSMFVLPTLPLPASRRRRGTVRPDRWARGQRMPHYHFVSLAGTESG